MSYVDAALRHAEEMEAEMNEEIQALIADLFDRASAHSQIVMGDSLTDDDEAFSASATPAEKLAAVRDYLRDSY